MSEKKNKGLRVFIDINILISAVLSETSISAKLLRKNMNWYQDLLSRVKMSERSKGTS